MNHIVNIKRAYFGIITSLTYLTAVLIALGYPAKVLLGCAIILGGLLPAAGLLLFKGKRR